MQTESNKVENQFVTVTTSWLPTWGKRPRNKRNEGKMLVLESVIFVFFFYVKSLSYDLTSDSTTQHVCIFLLNFPSINIYNFEALCTE